MQPGQPAGPKLPTGASHALALGCALAIGVFAYVAVYRPLASWREDLDRKSSLVRDRIGKGSELRREHAALVAELDELRAHVQRVTARVPDEAEEGTFLADLSRVARDHDVRIHDFRRSSDEAHETHSVMKIAVTADGTHAGLCAFLAGLDELPRLVPVHRLTIERGELDARYNMQLECSLYYGMRAPATSDAAIASTTGGLR
jgi:Tfp pilus assembly protein PilO